MIFDKLRLHHLRVGHVSDFDGNDFLPGNLRGAKTLRSEDNLVALVFGSDKQGSENTLRLDATGKSFQESFIEVPTRIRWRFGQHGDGKLTGYVVGNFGIHGDVLLSSGCGA
jgi:hypothetical protein